MASSSDSEARRPVANRRGLLLRVAPTGVNDSGRANALQNAVSDGFDVTHVATLREALERIAKSPVAAILVDLDLPDSEGMETLEALLRHAPRIPIVVQGRTADDDLSRSTLAAGAQDYLTDGARDGRTLASVLNAAIARQSARPASTDEGERALSTLDSLGDAIVCTDVSGRVTYLNGAAERLTGWTRREAIGCSAQEVFRVVDAHTHVAGRNTLDLAVRTNEIVAVSPNSAILRRDGTEVAIEDSIAPIHDRTGRVTGAVAVFRDVGASRTLAKRMSHWAHHDFLTDLPNRLMFSDRVTQSIALARRHGKQFAILFLDVDHLKQINDSFGHAQGDRVLKAIGARLVSCVRASDTVCRQGGDEFVILLSEIEHASDATLMAEKIRSALNSPCTIAEHTLRITASIGIGVFPRDGDDFESLINSADAAMYRAKERARTACCHAAELTLAQALARPGCEETQNKIANENDTSDTSDAGSERSDRLRLDSDGGTRNSGQPQGPLSAIRSEAPTSGD